MPDFGAILGSFASKVPGLPSIPGATVAVTGEASKAGTAPKLASYLIRSVDEAGKEVNKVAFLMPPQSLNAVRPWRGQATVDAAGKVSALDGGPGLGRWSINGTHGVWGPMGPDNKNRDAEKTLGLAAAEDVQAFFVDFAAANQKRLQENKAALRLQFLITGGGPSELQYRLLWIQPESAPSWTRSNANPMAWDWDWSFLVLGEETKDPAKKDPVGGPLAGTAASIAQKADALSSALDKLGLKPWDKNKGLFANLQTMVQNVKAIRSKAQAALAQGKVFVQGITDQAHALAQAATGILYDTRNAIRDVRAVTGSNIADIRKAARDAQRLAGEIKRAAQGGRRV